MRRTIGMTTAVCWAMLVAIFAVACVNHNQVEGDDRLRSAGDDPRQEIEDEFGPLSEEQIAGFEREITSQYRQLNLTYVEYDRLRNAPDEQVRENHDEHRLHRKLKRRHRTLARLHEDRMWLHVSRDGPSSDDRHLAEAHRAAAEWHGERFIPGGEGIDDQDDELELLRDQIESVGPDPSELGGESETREPTSR